MIEYWWITFVIIPIVIIVTMTFLVIYFKRLDPMFLEIDKGSNLWGDNLDDIKIRSGDLFMGVWTFPRKTRWQYKKTQEMFKDYIRAGLKKRDGLTTIIKSSRISGFYFGTAKKLLKVIEPAVFLFLILYIFILPDIIGKTVFLLIVAVYIFISLISTDQIFPKWSAETNGLILRGIFIKKTIPWQEINSIDFDIEGYFFRNYFVLQVSNESGQSFYLKASQLRKLLPIYDNVILHNPVLKVTT